MPRHILSTPCGSTPVQLSHHLLPPDAAGLEAQRVTELLMLCNQALNEATIAWLSWPLLLSCHGGAAASCTSCLRPALPPPAIKPISATTPPTVQPHTLSSKVITRNLSWADVAISIQAGWAGPAGTEVWLGHACWVSHIFSCPCSLPPALPTRWAQLQFKSHCWRPAAKHLCIHPPHNDLRMKPAMQQQTCSWPASLT